MVYRISTLSSLLRAQTSMKTPPLGTSATSASAAAAAGFFSMVFLTAAAAFLAGFFFDAGIVLKRTDALARDRHQLTMNS